MKRRNKNFYKELTPYGGSSELWNSIPYKTTTDFGFIKIPLGIKLKIYNKCPNYTLEEILGTYAAVNTEFSIYDEEKDFDLIESIRYKLDPKRYFL